MVTQIVSSKSKKGTPWCTLLPAPFSFCAVYFPYYVYISRGWTGGFGTQQ